MTNIPVFTVADLTGLAIEDLKVAKTIYAKFESI